MVTYEMLEAYKAAHKKIISEALKDYSKIESVADDARRAGIEAAIIEMEKKMKRYDMEKFESCGAMDCTMQETKHGDWVRYHDLSHSIKDDNLLSEIIGDVHDDV